MKAVLRDVGIAFASLLGAAISVHAAQVGNLPPERVAGVASYVSGGVSDGEVQRFQAAFKQYPLIVELYEHSGARDEYHLAAIDQNLTTLANRIWPPPPNMPAACTA